MKVVYKITNLVTNDFYIGATVNLGRRLGEHMDINSKSKISIAIQEYGRDLFKVEILEEVSNSTELASCEKKWIENLSPSYNTRNGGHRSVLFSKEHREKMRKISLQYWENLPASVKSDVIKRFKRAQIGHPVSEITREKLKRANLGKTLSSEVKQKIGNANKISMLGNTSGNKQVSSYDSTGLKVKTYPSVKAAAEDCFLHPSTVTAVLKGKRKTAAKLFWKYGV